MKRLWMFLLCTLAAVFLARSTPLRAAAAEGLALCAGSVIPALFPFMVTSSMLISLGFGTFLSPLLTPLMALYRLPGQAGAAVVLGLVGGYPIGAKTAARLCAEGRLTRSEGERLLTFCNNSGPVFLISVLGEGIFGSFRAGVYLWLIHLLSALLAGLFLRGGEGTERRAPPPPLAQGSEMSLSAAFVSAVRESSLTMVSVCGFVVFFYVLSRPLRLLPPPLSLAAVGAVELFSMTPLVTPDRLGFTLASAWAAFGGLSVLCQSAAALEGLSPVSLVKGKALQGILAGSLAFLLWPLL